MAEKTSNIVVGAMFAHGKLSPVVGRLSDKTLLNQVNLMPTILALRRAKNAKLHLPNGR